MKILTENFFGILILVSVNLECRSLY